MKKVVKTIEAPALVALDHIDTNKFFLATSFDGTLYVLRDWGTTQWGFRSVKNPDYGHTGAHPTQRAAIERAMTSEKAEVYQFDTFLELAGYVVDNNKR
jgi:hypothetical protein